MCTRDAANYDAVVEVVVVDRSAYRRNIVQKSRYFYTLYPVTSSVVLFVIHNVVPVCNNNDNNSKTIRGQELRVEGQQSRIEQLVSIIDTDISSEGSDTLNKGKIILIGACIHIYR